MITEKLHDPTRRPLATLLRSPAVYQRWLEHWAGGHARWRCEQRRWPQRRQLGW